MNEQLTFEIDKLSPEYVDEVYGLYTENNGFFDDGVDKFILSAETHWSYVDFCSILEDQKTINYAIFEKERVNTYNYYTEQAEPVVMNILKGFIVYEILKEKDDLYSILFLEFNKNVNEASVKIYCAAILDLLKSKSGKRGINKIRVEVEDGKYLLMKQLFENGFIKKDFIPSKKGPDIFIFQWNRPH